MKKAFIKINIIFLVCLCLMCIYLYWDPTILISDKEYTSFMGIVRYSPMLKIIFHVISLMAILVAKLILRTIHFYGNKLLVIEEKMASHVKLTNWIKWTQWLLNGLVFGKILLILGAVENLGK